jgi:hypothetical protein
MPSASILLDDISVSFFGLYPQPQLCVPFFFFKASQDTPSI